MPVRSVVKKRRIDPQDAGFNFAHGAEDLVGVWGIEIATQAVARTVGQGDDQHHATAGGAREIVLSCVHDEWGRQSQQIDVL